jgi:glycosyltransferase involved in cell wall biosynthesis
MTVNGLKRVEAVGEMKHKMLYVATYDVSLPGTGRTLRGKEMVNFFSERYRVQLVDFKEKGPSYGMVDREVSGLERQVKRSQVPFSRLGHYIFSPSLLRKTTMIMKDDGFDIIVADYGNAGIYGYLMAKRFGLPWVYCSMQVEYRRFIDFGRRDLRRFVFVPFLYLAERIGCSADLVVAISEPDAKIFSKWVDAERLIVVPQGFDEAIYHPFYKLETPKEPVVLFIGNYDYMPNKEAVDIIYKTILPKVIGQFSKAVFQFVGPNPPTYLYHPNIQFTGFVDDLVSYLRQAALVIVPVLHAGGMRTKIIESLACGKKVVSTEIGATGIPKYFSNLLIRDIDQFPSTICQILRSDEMVNGSDHDRFVEEFGWRNILDRLNIKIADMVDHQKRTSKHM